MADLYVTSPSSSSEEFSTFFNQFLHHHKNNNTDVGGSAFSCDSEKDGGEGSEAPSNSIRPRSSSSSKRSRAAEVHNMSEKRRRSRINEKMKALQSLIPNSNKTDKASMLDEAIEYLKQLQLQVQMLSMRNGLGLNPLCLPGVMQLPTAMSFDESNGLLTTCTESAMVSTNAESMTQAAFNLTNQSTPTNQSIVLPSVTSMTSETLFGFDPHVQLPYGPFNPHTSPKQCFKAGKSQHKLDTDDTGRNSSSGLSW